MSTTNPKIDWTKADEHKLKELTERKAAFERASRKPLFEFVETHFSHWTMENKKQAVMFMIQQADTIRDLLQPFDSGVRAAPPEN